MKTSPNKYKPLDYKFGILIQSYRQKARFTQPQLAKLVGVTKRAVLNWEGGSSYPQINHLRRLVEIFFGQGCFTRGTELEEARYLWEKATEAKKEIRDAFDPAWFNSLMKKPNHFLRSEPLTLFQDLHRQDWSEAVENRLLYGREEEAAQLESWIIRDKQRLVGIFGMGGIGKTGLAVRAAHQLAPQFEFVIFRSLHNAPRLGELLDSVLRFLLDNQLDDLPVLQSEKVALLLDYLSNYRCLLVLDNLETLMQTGLPAGEFRAGYSDYADFFRRADEIAHKSCLLITSREKPRQVAFREAKNGHVRLLALTGLDTRSCQAILQSVNIFSNEEQSSIFTRRYGGNPLALKLIATPIKEIFGGNIETFLTSRFFHYGDSELRYILDQHFERLSAVEQEILYWLAVSREPLILETLQKKSLLSSGIQTFADGLSALVKRFLIEQSASQDTKYKGEEDNSAGGGNSPSRFTLQGVVIEYVTQRLLNQLHTEIISLTPETLYLYPLLQTQSREYIRQTQLRVLIAPLLEQLQITLKNKEVIEIYLKQILESLKALSRNKQGYAPGNILNLLIQSGTDLTGFHLNGLALWQTNLAGVELHAVNMQGADLAGAIFTEAHISAFSLALSPDGKTLAIGCANGSVKLWQIARNFGSQLFECRGHTNLVGTLAFSPDGTILASGSTDGTVRLWELESGSCLAVLNDAAATATVRSVAFSPDGKLLASAGDDAYIRLWQVSDANLIASVPGDQGWIMSVAFNPDSNLLASGGFTSTLKLWDVSAPHKGIIPFATLGGHEQWVCTVQFSPDGKLLASGSADQSVRLWSVPHGTLKDTLLAHTGIVTTVSFSPDGKLLLSSGADKRINLYNLANPVLRKSISAGNGEIIELAFNPAGETFVSTSGELSNVKLWSVKSLEELDVLRGYSNLIYSIAISPDGKWLGVGGIDYNLQLWDLEASSPGGPVILKGHGGFVSTLAFSSDGQGIATSSNDSTIKLWNLNGKKVWRSLVGPQRMVTSIVFGFNNRLLISGDEKGFLLVWSLITGTELTSQMAHQGRIRKLTFSPDGQILASAAEDGLIKLWGVDLVNTAFQLLDTWFDQKGLVMSVAFNSEGSQLFSGGSDGIIRCWDVTSGECTYRVNAHKGVLWSMETSPDRRKLATAGEDGFVHLWNIENSESKAPELLTSFAHETMVLALAFSPDGRRLFSAGEGGKIKIWNLDDRSGTSPSPSPSTGVGALATTLNPPPPYAGLNITGVTGLTEAQRLNLLSLGATEFGAGTESETCG